jgi:hypothetical protein
VDAADVIAILVRSHVIKLEPSSLKNGVEVALHLAVDGLAYLYLVIPQLLKQVAHIETVIGKTVISNRWFNL